MAAMGHSTVRSLAIRCRTSCLWRSFGAPLRPRSGLLIGLCLFLLFGALGPIPAKAEIAAAPEDERIGAVLLCNIENNLTLYEKEADTPIYPSSSVKIMTGLLACRALSERLDETVTVTSAMLAGVTGRQLHLADGEKLTVRDLLYAAICGSYNDAATVLACLVSGSVVSFVNDMNREAERLGMTTTVYTNPTGLHDPAMATCARDVALVAREAYTDVLYMTISSARTYTIPATNVSDERLLTNRNALISGSSQNYYNGYCLGLNAGMTDEGGWCVVTICEKGGAANLCVTMKGADVSESEWIPAYMYTNKLLAWANNAYTYRTVLTAGDVFHSLPVGMTGISKSTADLALAEDLKVYLPADADISSELTFDTIIPDGKLVAPLTAGDIVGQVSVSYEGRVIGRASLYVTEDFSQNAFVGGLMTFRSYLCSRAFWIAVIAFLLLLLPFLRMTASTNGRYGLRSTGRRRRIKYKKRRY